MIQENLVSVKKEKRKSSDSRGVHKRSNRGWRRIKIIPKQVSRTSQWQKSIFISFFAVQVLLLIIGVVHEMM